jgi:hypothetical protein
MRIAISPRFAASNLSGREKVSGIRLLLYKARRGGGKGKSE